MKKFLLALGLSAALALSASAAAPGTAPSPGADDYDRLDGMGASGKKVNVVEWEGNLEVHVYPGGSLRGLALKLDKRNKDKPVMVIGYRFDSDPDKQLIRRAILGITLNEGFKVYRDPSAGSEYDKIVISNNGLAGDMVAFHTDPAPTQLYPDGHPALANGPDGGKNGWQNGNPAAPAANADARQPASTKEGSMDRPKAKIEDGTIQPFFMGN
jgi:opacity protein-like surface antigen